MTQRPVSVETRLVMIRYETEDVRVFKFARLDGAPMPPSSPGAHIDVNLGGGLVRQYSLLDTGPDLTCWTIGVRRNAGGRGGSVAMHDRLRVGDIVRLSGPRNAFELVDDAPYSVLIGGGIGVTPLVAMARHLARCGAPFEFHVAHRSRAAAALLRDLPPDVRLHYDDEKGGILDVAAIVRAAPAGAHLYCCGPKPMIAGFLKAAEQRPTSNVHIEYFEAAAAPEKAGDTFTVELRRSGKMIEINPGETIIQAIRAAGVKANSSCEQGICGVCEVGVLAGMPDHRDTVLTDLERQANRTMMICCSRSHSPSLVLDL